jgi:hypothetical protein
MNPLHSAALAYATLGWPVFPLTPGEKVPLYRNPHPKDSAERHACGGYLDCGKFGHGVLDATTDPATIELWWTRQPAAGIGMACGVTYERRPTTRGRKLQLAERAAPDVLDIDVKKDAPGALSRERLRQAGYLTGCWAQVRTPSGGEHLYFDGTDQGNGSIRGAGVDFRSAGGYVVMPPTPVRVQLDGDVPGYVAEYRWLTTPNLNKEGGCDWPAVRKFLAPPHLWPPREPGRPLDTSVAGLVAWLEKQGEGNRNAALHWSVCKALESDHGADIEALASAGRGIGLGESEIAKTVASARRKVLLAGVAGGAR